MTEEEQDDYAEHLISYCGYIPPSAMGCIPPYYMSPSDAQKYIEGLKEQAEQEKNKSTASNNDNLIKENRQMLTILKLIESDLDKFDNISYTTKYEIRKFFS